MPRLSQIWIGKLLKPKQKNWQLFRRKRELGLKKRRFKNFNVRLMQRPKGEL